jgi:DNA-binding MarR family transcriptional regulator/N-acetylglutamate synthase-like GNAT family acetyltransferase
MNRIEAVRRFNRFYTRRIGALQQGYMGSPFPLPQCRVLYELGQRGEATASELGGELDLDLGYLSRLLQSLRRQGMVQGEAAKEDARRVRLSLTAKGRKAYQQLDGRSRELVAGMLGKLAAPDQARLVGALQAVETVLEESPRAEPRITLRSHRPGDMGWVVERHAALYYEQDGWGAPFEALIAGIVQDFLETFDAERERCWIAERDGERVGCVFVVKQSSTTAKLRLLIVEPSARGAGLGRRLVDECIAFARAKGYKKLVLWTHAHLVAARAIYRDAGFKKLPKTEVHDTFGPKAVSEFWELKLPSTRA